jgi:uncharacterized coiled-coil DUF342 family protein
MPSRYIKEINVECINQQMTQNIWEYTSLILNKTQSQNNCHEIQYDKHLFNLIDELKKEINEFKIENHNLRDEMKGLHIEIHNLRDEMKGLHSEIHNLQDEMKELHSEIHNLQDEINDKKKHKHYKK